MSRPRRGETLMIIASVNGTHGHGFLETIQREDGTVLRAGLLKVGAQHAQRLRRLIDDQEPLVYSGPVFVDGGWRAQTFPIVAISMVPDPVAPSTMCVTLCDKDAAMPATTSIALIGRMMLRIT